MHHIKKSNMLISETQQGYDYDDLSIHQHGVNYEMIQLGSFQRESWVSSYKTPFAAYIRFQHGVSYDQHVYTKEGYLSFGVPEPGNPDTWTYQHFVPNDGLRNFDACDYDSIIELAGVNGFWHMGQFAADYRRIYGQLPSETLNRK